MKLTLLLIPLLLLSSCTIDWSDEKDAKIAELEKQIQDDIFKKRQECFKYKEIVKAEYADDLNYNFWNIYYSKKYDSCLYRISRSTPGDFDHIIYDYLSGKEITWKNDTCDINDTACTNRQEVFNNTLE